jgi:hypothetical protein
MSGSDGSPKGVPDWMGLSGWDTVRFSQILCAGTVLTFVDRVLICPRTPVLTCSPRTSRQIHIRCTSGCASIVRCGPSTRHAAGCGWSPATPTPGRCSPTRVWSSGRPGWTPSISRSGCSTTTCSAPIRRRTPGCAGWSPRSSHPAASRVSGHGCGRSPSRWSRRWPERRARSTVASTLRASTVAPIWWPTSPSRCRSR